MPLAAFISRYFFATRSNADLSLLDQRNVDGIVHFLRNEPVEIGQILLREPRRLTRTNGLLDHGDGDLLRNVPDAAQIRKHLPLRQLLLRDVIRQRLGRHVQHPIAHGPRAAERRPQPDSREDEHVVALGGAERPPVVHFHGVERAAAGEDAPSVGPLERLLGRALRLRRGVGQGEDDGPLAVFRHVPDEPLGEQPAHGGHAEDHGGLVLVDDLRQRQPAVGVAGERRLLVRQLAQSLRSQEAVLVRDEEALPRLLLRPSVLHHRLHQNLSDSDTGAARTGDQNSLIPEGCGLFALGAQASQYSRQRRRPRSLDVVVEAQEVVAVLVEDLLCLVAAEILELDEHVRPAMAHRLEELVHQVVVRRPLQPRLLHAEVEFILQQRLVVGAHVQHDRHDAMGRDPSGRAVQAQLSDGYSHPVRAEVAEA
mmetsp:Transcript_15186/g.33144  ORF Transcript_15186/g.33144 Transcript_15186/m.33144 type:complete len:425 (+) Transcript_15186:6-1280(+)